MLSPATHSPRVPHKPLLAIVGATGTGKSKLAVELAKRFDGEIINGDAMQLYAGLPIITNKISYTEQEGIPHHLLGCISLREPTWVVSTFVKRALQVIEEIHSRGKLPILVGGTHYYTQSLLFREALAEADDDGIPVGNVDLSPEEQWPILSQPTDVVLAELRKVDPVMASRWHPNDRRKIQRSLMIYLQSGRPASDIYAEQQAVKGKLDKLGEAQSERSVRFPTLLFWVHAGTDALLQRLDDRVYTMLDNGLLSEVDQLQQHAAHELAEGRTIDDTRGIWVSIGFKEFKQYHEALTATSNAATLAKAKADAIERTKIANRQYAKRQVRWIRIKLVDSLEQAGVNQSLYLLDSSDATKFDENVIRPAAELTAKYLDGKAMPLPSTLSSAAAALLGRVRGIDAPGPAVRTVQHCDTCDTTCSTEASWLEHLKSKKHRKLVSKQCNSKESIVSASVDNVDKQ